MAKIAKSYILMKAKPGKENSIWISLVIMSVLREKSEVVQIEEVHFVYGPYDLAVTLAGPIEEIEKTAFVIREKLGVYLNDTLTLLGTEPPFSAGKCKKLIKHYISDQIRELENMDEKENISFDVFRKIVEENKTTMRELCKKLLSSDA